MKKYKLNVNSDSVVNGIAEITDGIYKFFPMDQVNTDYQEYLKWLDEGNTPEPADPVGE